MRRGTVVMLVALGAVAALGAIGANPRYIEELRVGGGFGESVDGGIDFEDDGTILTDGSVRTPEVQFVDAGLTDDGTPSNTLYLQRRAADVASRLYVLPNGDPGVGTRASVKVFFDDFADDQTNYRDMGFTASTTLTSSAGGGVFQINSKANGSKTNADLAFTFQDTVIAGRWIYNGGSPSLIIGGGTTLATTSNRLQVDNGDIGMANNRFVRWKIAAGTANSGIKLNTADDFEFVVAGNSVAALDGVGTLQVDGDLNVDGNDIDIGDAGGFSGMKFNTSSNHVEFWIDGTKVGHVGTNGAYVDDVP